MFAGVSSFKNLIRYRHKRYFDCLIAVCDLSVVHITRKLEILNLSRPLSLNIL